MALLVFISFWIFFYLMTWLLAFTANRIYPRFSKKRYFLILFLVPIAIELALVLSAFIMPDFGRTIDLKAIYRQAQFTTGSQRDQVEVKAAALAQKKILRHHPIGSDANSLVEYLVKSGVTCGKIPKEAWSYRYCYFAHGHPERFGIIRWNFDITNIGNNKISKINVSTIDETD